MYSRLARLSSLPLNSAREGATHFISQRALVTEETSVPERGIVAVLYAHPEAYPPTLSAVDELSKFYPVVHVLYRPNLPGRRRYAANIKLHPSGQVLTVEEQAALPAVRRYAMFAEFAMRLRRLLDEYDPDTLLLYDSLALLAYALVSPLSSWRGRLWYHSHDVVYPSTLRPLSLAWLGHRVEQAFFSKIALFTLPAREREAFFPMSRLRGRYIFLPNLPSQRLVATPRPEPLPGEKVRILFQGRIYEGHGIEEVIELLANRNWADRAELVLVGSVAPQFEVTLQELIARYCVADRVHVLGYRPYDELHAVTRSCHVGLAVYRGSDAMNRTVGTASNKIYEYAAAGLPVIYLDSPHFRSHLERFRWAVGYDGTRSGLEHALQCIRESYRSMSKAAIDDAREILNYERAFAPVRAFLQR